MVPPPSQQGKFKPRKPAKKIRPGTTTAGSSSDGAAASDTATNPTVAFALTAGEAGDRSDASKARPGMGGRGGREARGRGRGRAPIPSGRVFFSGGAEPTSKRRPFGSSSTSAISKTSAAKASTDKSTPKDVETTEEVVGQLETAIGTMPDGNFSSSRSDNERSGGTALDYDMNEQAGGETVVKGSFALDAFMYDSDSSREADLEKSERKKPSNIRPLELPFPSQPLPLGVGCSSRPVAYERVTSSSDPYGRGVVGTIHQELPEPTMSPFVNSSNRADLALEQNSWFLVQLPTRLPPLKPATTNRPPTVLSADDEAMEDADSSGNTRQTPTFSDVVTPPLVSKSHDHVLTGTAPGRIGKILVYRSGRTILKMEGSDGAEPILMQVSEGLTCSFHQEAVVIEQETARFLALGNVNKSIVVTPDLSSTLVAE